MRTDVFIHFALISAQAALADSGVKIDGQNDRVGVSIGTGMGGIPLLLSSWETLRQEGMRRSQRVRLAGQPSEHGGRVGVHAHRGPRPAVQPVDGLRRQQPGGR